ncbi:MAG: sigma-70 family RNA polymerase sigma factor [Deltaproteobacteria bacterium]|nr:sigma-70 family RNA polymerase sigma factor [Deltaproteobacteria bacterium]
MSSSADDSGEGTSTDSVGPAQLEVTGLLKDWGEGDSSALDRLLPLVYEELHRLAKRAMRRERADHTLQATALLHEAYLRLVDQKQASWSNRAQFFGVAAQAMRRILVDHARGRATAKREGEMNTVMLEEVSTFAEARPPSLLALDDALKGLADLDSRKSKVVELRIFGGLTIPETAEALGVSTGTVIEDYKTARAWLFLELSPKP